MADTEITTNFVPVKKVGEPSFQPVTKAEIQPESPIDDDLTWREAFTSAVERIPSSALETGKEMVTPFVHPIETGKAVGRLAAGTKQKLFPGRGYISPTEREFKGEYEQYAEQFVDMMKERYGSVENFKKTIAGDPVGVAADLATAFMGAGYALKGAGAAGKIGALSRAGRALERIGAATEPLNIAARGMALPLKLIPEKVPSRLYRSGAKFSTTLPREQRLALAKTALDNEIMPTIRGLDKLRDGIDNLNSTISAKIDSAVRTGNKIPVENLFKGFKELSAEYSLSGKPISNIKIIEGIQKQIETINKKMKRVALTPAEAQKLKQKIYKDLQSYYAAVKESPAAVKAQKLVARNAKEALEDIIPEIKQLNKEEGALIDLHDAIERSAARISNRDLIGIGLPIKGGVGGIATQGPAGVVGGLALGILDTPRVKSRVAIVINRLKKKGIKVKPSRALSRLLFIKAGEAKEQQTILPIQ